MVFKSTTDRWLIHSLIALSTIGLMLLVFAFLLPKSAAAGEHEYTGFKKCKSCHKKEAIGNQIGVWMESKHAKAYETLATEKSKKWAAEAGVGDPQTDERCIKCHSTAHGVPDDMVSKKFDRTAGVQCESCHGPGKDYRKKKIMIDHDKAVEKGLILPTAAVCTTCHNDESPAWDPKRYTLADGSTTGFDYDQAAKAIAHPVPEGYDPSAEGEAD
jgi:YD repeat-containing protein